MSLDNDIRLKATPSEIECIPCGMHFFCKKSMASNRMLK